MFYSIETTDALYRPGYTIFRVITTCVSNTYFLKSGFSSSCNEWCQHSTKSLMFGVRCISTNLLLSSLARFLSYSVEPAGVMSPTSWYSAAAHTKISCLFL